MIGYRSRSKNGKAPERMIAAIGSRANDYRFDRRWPSAIRVGCPSQCAYERQINSNVQACTVSPVAPVRVAPLAAWLLFGVAPQ
jgi:hypothetical protein